MCKIAAVAGIKKSKMDETWMFLELLGQVMSTFNRDGLGYAAIGRDKKLFGEKWLFNNSAFRDPYSNKTMAKILEDLKDVVRPIETYGFFGEKVDREEAASVILHARAATTGGVSIKNTHPFLNKQDKPTMALIHNGGISNHQRLTKKFSECDSETILHEYIDAKVNENVDNVQAMANNLVGWYACALLNAEAPEPYLDIFTDGTPIHTAYIEELGVFVFSTQGVDIMEIAKSLDLHAYSLSRMRGDTLIRFNAMTGKPMASKRFDSDVKTVFQLPGGNIIDMSGSGSGPNVMTAAEIAQVQEGTEEFPLSSLVHLCNKAGLE